MLKGNEEGHMLEHKMMCHREGPNPEFRFSVVKNCKSALERQVKESVRIQLRGSVLNKKGTYNSSPYP